MVAEILTRGGLDIEYGMHSQRFDSTNPGSLQPTDGGAFVGMNCGNCFWTKAGDQRAGGQRSLGIAIANRLKHFHASFDGIDANPSSGGAIAGQDINQVIPSCFDNGSSIQNDTQHLLFTIFLDGCYLCDAVAFEGTIKHFQSNQVFLYDLADRDRTVGG